MEVSADTNKIRDGDRPTAIRPPSLRHDLSTNHRTQFTGSLRENSLILRSTSAVPSYTSYDKFHCPDYDVRQYCAV